MNYSKLLLLTITLLGGLTAQADSPNSARRLKMAADEQRTIEVADPEGTTPLTPSEIARSKQLTDGSNHIRQFRAHAGRGNRGRGLEQLEPVQFLYMQRRLDDKNAASSARVAETFHYDYSTNQAIKTVVDLTNNTVLETTVSQGVENQPFFSSTEIKTALQLIFDHPELGPRLRHAYQEITGQTLTDISQLIAQGGVFFPESAENTALRAVTSNCNINRCMQLFVSVDDRNFIDVTNLVVDLTQGQVLWVEEGLAGHTH